MIETKKIVLSNGLRVVLHCDKSTPLVAVNMLYNIGSKHEVPTQTGLAHLFEHLMFSGSENAKDYDTPIQNAGGENNAFTNSDMTNFYSIVPANNLDTLLWLESDRMANLKITQDSLQVQKSVVIEEFKETCLNEPYGDLWHHLSALSYEDHPYRWPTIGKIPAHIEQTKHSDVMEFYKNNYNPANAILCVAGNINYEDVILKVKKWFGEIKGTIPERAPIPQEKVQTQLKEIKHNAKVPNTALYFSFHTVGRNHPDYYATDLVSDILSHGRSSRFYTQLYKPNKYFQSIDAYITGTMDPGLLVIDSKLLDHTYIDKAKTSIWEQINKMLEEGIGENELQKVKNKAISAMAFSDISILNKTISIAYFELCGDADLINKQEDLYNEVQLEDVNRVAKEILKEQNCSILAYGPE